MAFAASGRAHCGERGCSGSVVDEIGHVLGLPHNEQPGCLMNDAEGTVATLDRSKGILCEPTIEHIESTHGIEMPRHESINWSIVTGSTASTSAAR